MSLKTKIAVIIPYFGPWPEWKVYFLKSCELNPEITWIFPTDNPPSIINYPNLRFVPFSLKDFNVKASELLQLDINIKHPYKICDFKPAYADIFSDLISEFDFWGYGDLDLVYGKIRNHFSDELFETYDILSNHPDFITGHFCLLRNDPEINLLYRPGEAYIKAFTDKKYTGFDEQIKNLKINPDPRMMDIEQKIDRTGHILYSKSRKALKNLIPYKTIQKMEKREVLELKDFTSIVRFAEINSGLRVRRSLTFESDLMMEKQNQKDWKVEWQEGQLINKNDKELLYFHFMLSKNRKSFKIDPQTENISRFSISRAGINPIT